MRRWSIVLVAVLVAGCSKDAPTPQEDLRLETGSVRGVVLDTTITPIAGANVTIDGTSVVTQTNAEGAFGFDDMAVGTYFLRATAPGYNGAQVTVDVQDRDIAQAKIVLQPKQVITPFVQPYQFDGILECSYRVLITGDNCPDTEADVLYPLEQVPQWVQSELEWSSTQSLGDELSFQYTIPDTTVDYIEIEGTSPLTIFAPPDEVLRHGLGDGLDLWLRVFTADLEATEPPGYWGIGAQIDQEFTIFTHVFYHMQPAPGWTFLGDGAPT